MKKSFILSVFLLFFSLWVSSSAANYTEPEWGYFWQKVGQNPGVNDIALDATYAWGARAYAVIRWHKENHTFRTFNFTSRVTVVETTPNNDLWVGTQDGLYRFDGSNWIRYTASGGLYVTSLSVGPQGQLLVGAVANILVYDGTNWSVIPTLGSQSDPVGCFQHNYIVNLAIDNQGRTWASLSGGTCYYNQEFWQPLHDESLVIVSKEIAPHPNGDVWFAGVYDVGGFKAAARLTPGGDWIAYSGGNLPTSSNSLTIDQNGHIWLGHDNGVSHFDGASWTAYHHFSGFYGGAVFAVKADSDGSIWTGSATVSRFHNTVWQTYLAGLPVNPMHQYGQALYVAPDNALWFSVYDRGVVRIDGGTLRHYLPPQGLAGAVVDAIVTDQNGHIWFGCAEDQSFLGKVGRGLTHFDGVNWQTFTTADGLAHNLIGNFAVDNENNLWITHPLGGGVTRKSASDWTVYGMSDGLLDDTTQAIIFHDGAIWVGYRASNGAVRFDGANWVNYNSADGLEGGVRRFVIDRDNTLWALTEVNLFKWDGDGWLDMGIPGQWYTMAVDIENRIWLVDGSDAAWFDGSQLHPATPAQTGGYHIWQNVAANESGDTLWFGSNQGVVNLKIFEIRSRIFLPAVSGGG